MQISKHLAISVTPRESSWLMTLLEEWARMDQDDLACARLGQLMTQLQTESEIVLINETEFETLTILAERHMEGDVGERVVEFCNNLRRSLQARGDL